MSLWILNNANSGSVVNDLRTICPDPAMSVDTWISQDRMNRGSGAVTYPAPTMSSVGCQIVHQLVSSPIPIGIRGEQDGWSAAPAAGMTLRDVGGWQEVDKLPGPTFIELVYNVYPCGGLGFWVTDNTGAHISCPTDVALFHELAHGLNPTASEDSITTIENTYRAERGLKLRSGHGGGCNLPQQGSQPAPRPTSDCFIATAAFGSPLEPEVQILRSFRDNILRQTRTGERFFDAYWKHYYRISPLVVQVMQEDPEVKDLVRWSLVTPIVRYLELLLAFPDASLDSLDEPWRSFLGKMRGDMEAWVDEIDLPRSFRGLDVASAAQEIGIVLAYGLRSEAKREAYLKDLEQAGEIPLAGTAAELRKAASQLQRYPVSQHLVQRILKNVPLQSPGLVSTYMNGVEVLVAPQLPAVSDWVYQVQVTNLSPSTFGEITLFYDQTDAIGAVVLLKQVSVQSGQVAKFELGPCSLLNGYVIGFFDLTGTLVAQIPDPTNPIFQGQTHITPALDQQIHPNDPPCLSGWTIH